MVMRTSTSLITRLTLGIVLGIASTAIRAQVSDPVVGTFDRMMALEARSADGRWRIQGRNILIGNARLRVLPVVEQRMTSGRNHLVGVRFEVEINGRRMPNLVCGQVGVGETGEEADQQAVRTWQGTFGEALFAALAAVPAEQRRRGHAVHEGALAIRFTTEQESLARHPALSVAAALDALAPILPVPDGSLHSVQIHVLVEPGRSADVEVSIDGKDSLAGMERLAALPWPRQSGPYSVKRALILRPDTP
jgi:Family of unknown function (DUF6348)